MASKAKFSGPPQLIETQDGEPVASTAMLTASMKPWLLFGAK